MLTLERIELPERRLLAAVVFEPYQKVEDKRSRAIWRRLIFLAAAVSHSRSHEPK